jgi:hypothetical protein
MANCDNCNKMILWGGQKVDQFTFCSKSCLISGGPDFIASVNLPDELIRPELARLHESNCPKCKGPGPVDVHHYSSIWSIVYFTRWTTKNRIVCRSCGVKSQIFASIFSLLFGWWGFPWGILITPLQIWRNIQAIAFPFSTLRPSPDFEKTIRLAMVRRERASAPQPSTHSA